MLPRRSSSLPFAPGFAGSGARAPSSERFSLLISGLALWGEILFAQVAHTAIVQQLGTHRAPSLLPVMPLAPRTPGFSEHPAPQQPTSTTRSSGQTFPASLFSCLLRLGCTSVGCCRVLSLCRFEYTDAAKAARHLQCRCSYQLPHG